MYLISKLAQKAGVSRTTILYYEQQQLIAASSRTPAGYRLYDEKALQRLLKITDYRKAGLSVVTIKTLLEQKNKQHVQLLEQHLLDLNNQIHQLRQQQRLVIQLLNNDKLVKQAKTLTKQQWVAILRASGMSDEDMLHWHQQFEKSAPEAHQDFLEALGITPTEIQSIRKRSQP